MSMAQELDYTTLKWVKEEIDESLKQTRQALEAYVENPDDHAQIRFCTTYLHQVYGTLQMVEIYGAALLAEEMERLAEALSEDKIKQKDNAFDVLMRAILQLPSYLEHIEQGHSDQPVILLPLLNDLRSARGEHLLSDNAFFSPDLSIKPPEVLSEKPKKVDIKLYSKKLRPVFQASLVGIYRNQNEGPNLRKIAAVVKEFHLHSDTENATRFWWVASGVLEALLEGGLKLSNPIKQTLGQLDKDIKRVMQHGSQAFDKNPSADLLKTLLYYVATANSNGPRVQQIKSSFQLGELVPSGTNLNEAFDSLRGSSTDLLQSVSTVIKEDLLQVKDDLDLFVRNTNKPAADLQPLCNQLDRISDTLVMLGFGDLRKIIQEQITNIGEFIATDTQPTETKLMEIASALLYIESSLDGIDNLSTSEIDGEAGLLGNRTGATLLPPSEQKQLAKLVISQAKEVLLKVKESFNTYANDTSAIDVISHTPEQLFQVKGVLAVLSLEHAANILQSAIKYIKTELVVAKKQPDQTQLDAVADVVSSIEYYLEAIAEARSGADSLLDTASKSLSTLNYPVDVPVAPVPRSAVDDSTLAIEDFETESFELEADVDEEVERTTRYEPAAAENINTTVETPKFDVPEPNDIQEPVIEPGAEIEFEIEPELDIPAISSEPEPVPEFKIELEPEDKPGFDLEKDTGAIPEAVSQIDTESIENRPIEAPSPSTKPAPPKLSDNIDEEILEIFVEEADEVFVVMKEKLAAWKANNADDDSLGVLRRSYHTIKGSGRLAGAVVLGEFAWSMENMLNHVIDKKVETSPQLFTLLEDAEGVLANFIEQLKGSNNDVPDIQPYIDRAHAINENKAHELVAAAAGADASVISEQQSDDTQPTPTAIDLPTQDVLLSDIFKRETHNHILSLRTYISNFVESGENHVNDSLMRALHTLHGSARMAEATPVASLSEDLDRYFRTLHDKNLLVTNNALKVLKNSADIIDNAVKNDLLEHQIADSIAPIHRQIAELHVIANAAAAVQDNGIEHDVPEVQSLAQAAASLETMEFTEKLNDKLEQANPLNDTVDSTEQPKIEADDDELKSIFLDESVELFKELEKLITRWNYAPDDINTMDNLQSAFHRLSGGAKVANIVPIVNLCQGLENVLKAHTTQQKPVTTELIKLYQNSFDWLTESGAKLRNGQPVALDRSLDDSIDKYLGKAASIAELEERNKTVEVPLPSFSANDLLAESESGEGKTDVADRELLSIFVEEAKEILANNETTLDIWRVDIDNVEHIGELQRALHTLKGGARMASVTAIGDLAHVLETLLESILEDKLEISADCHQLVETCHDWLTIAVDKASRLEEIESANNLMAKIDAVLGLGVPSEEHDTQAVDIERATEENTEQEIDAFAVNTDIDNSIPEFDVNIPDLEPTPFSITDFDVALPTGETAEISPEYDEELIEIFLEEAAEIQESSEKVLHIWQSDIDNREHIGELQRALHTLKGGARMANITAIGDLSHAIESLLESVTENRLEPTPDFPVIVQTCHDWLAVAIDHVKQKASIEPASELIQQLENLLAGKPLADAAELAKFAKPEPAPEPTAVEEPVEPAQLIELPTVEEDKAAAEIEEIKARIASPRTPNELIRVKAEIIDDLVNYAGETNIYNSRIGQQLNAWQFNLTEFHSTVLRLHEQLRKFEIETEAQIMYRHTAEDTVSDAHDDFDPLEMDRFSTMQQLSRSMVESLGDLTSIENLMHNITSEASVLLLQQSRVNTELQEGLMNTRMTPFSSVLARLQRIIRQTCQETNKEAKLDVVGAEGEMDRTQLNRIVPALEHILRNAIDHGIEIPADREKTGKSPVGNIEIRLERESSEVVLRISDDGAGINLESIRQKALEKGFMGTESKISDNEIIEFILQSGFSTASQVTQISGRGIGMDVVNTEIKQLNGSLHIESEQGKGSTFTVRLPLTVLVNQALLVNVVETTYAIQLTNIEHVIRVSSNDLNKLISSEQESYDYAGNQYQYLNLGYILHNKRLKTVSGKQKFPLLLGRSGDHRVAMQIDQLLGRQEIVIKSVGPQLSQINYISGATILPDGEIALILDISTLIRRNLALQQLDEAQHRELPPSQGIEARQPTVMIVDDSITVRKVTERLLKRHEFKTVTAKDGVDALTALFEQIPDIMLLDVEMPRMDGYELATAIRNDERLKHIPIIMITSRTGEKHRERALNIGVNMYMGKPYQETELIENIHSLLAKS